MSNTTTNANNTTSTDLRGLRALKLITVVVVFFTLYDVFQFQRSFYSNPKVHSGSDRELQSQQSQLQPPSQSAFIPLDVLTRANEDVVCPLPGELFPVEMIVNATAESPTASGFLIPRIFHQTGEGKCLTKPFYDNAKTWSFEGAGFSFYFHDAQAKQMLLQKFWPEFPQLQNAFQCLKNAGGAAVADLWRYLAIWEYGGFYTDMDNEPGPYLNSSTVNHILAPDIDAFFLQDKPASPGFPTQYFFGASPKHPIMFFAVYEVLQAMLGLQEVGTFYVPEITGPSALDRAFLQFMKVPKKDYNEKQKWLHHPLTKPTKGTYTGHLNRTVTIAANQANLWNYIHAGSINGRRKREGWKKMNYTNYQGMNKIPQNKTCIQVIMEQHMQRLGIFTSGAPQELTNQLQG